MRARRLTRLPPGLSRASSHAESAVRPCDRNARLGQVQLRPHHPRQGQHVDRRRAGAQQHPGAGLDRGAGGQHVVDHRDGAAGKRSAHGECAPEQRPALENFMAKLYAKIPSLRIEDRTQTTLDLDALKSELTIRGSFVRRLMANAPADEGDRALDEAALRHGLRALQGQKDLP